MDFKYSQSRLAVDHVVKTPVSKRMRPRARSSPLEQQQEAKQLFDQYLGYYRQILDNLDNLNGCLFKAADADDQLEVSVLRRLMKLDRREVCELIQRFGELQQHPGLPLRAKAKIPIMVTRLTFHRGLLARLVQVGNMYAFVEEFRPLVEQAFNSQVPVPTEEFFRDHLDDESDYKSDVPATPVSHFSQINHDGTFNPGEDFATNAHQELSDDEHPPQSAESGDDEFPPERPPTVLGKRKSEGPSNDHYATQAKSLAVRNLVLRREAETALRGRFERENSPDTPRKYSKPSNTVRRPLAYENSRVQFYEAAETVKPDKYTPRGSSPPPQPPKKRTTPNFVGPHAAAQKLSHVLAKATGGIPQDELMEAVEELVAQVRGPSNKSTPQKPDLKLTFPTGFFKPKRTDFDVTKTAFWKHFHSLDLEKFTGKPGTQPFAAWWTLFDHEVNRLPEPYCTDNLRVRALYRLMDGVPKTLVEPFYNNITEDSYKQAVHVLHSRYGSTVKTRELVEDRLRLLKPTGSSCAAQADFITKIQSACADLQVAGVGREDASMQCIKLALRKMATSYSDKYYISLGLHQKSDIDHFYEDDPAAHLLHLQSWINGLRAETQSSEDEESKAAPKDSTVSSFVSVNAGRPRSPHNRSPKAKGKPRQVRGWRCPYDKTDEHTWMQCTHDMATRRKIVQEERLCENCLKTGHVTKDCPSEMSCYFCGARGKWYYHHSSLCTSREAQEARRTNTPIDWRAYKNQTKEKEGSAHRSKKQEAFQKFKKQVKDLPKPQRSVFATLLRTLDSDASVDVSEDEPNKDGTQEEEASEGRPDKIKEDQPESENNQPQPQQKD